MRREGGPARLARPPGPRSDGGGAAQRGAEHGERLDLLAVRRGRFDRDLVHAGQVSVTEDPTVELRAETVVSAPPCVDAVHR